MSVKIELKDFIKKDCKEPVELTEEDLKAVSGGETTLTSMYLFCEFTCPKCGKTHQVGFWLMNNGLSESEPHVQDTCSAGKVEAITYRSNHPMLRLVSNDLIEYTIIAYRNQDAEWFYLK